MPREINNIGRFVTDPEQSWTLPGHFYHDHDIYQRALDTIFYRSWQYACHISRLRAPGRYFVREIGGQSVVVLRDDDGEIRAYHNVCQHRAHRLLEGEGSVRNAITCPYHAWRYGFDGELRYARGSEKMPAFPRQEIRLQAVKVDQICGFVFVNLDPHAVPMAETYPGLEEEIFGLAPDAVSLSRAHVQDYPLAANWKNSIENYSECYHCPNRHPSLVNQAIDITGYRIEIHPGYHRHITRDVGERQGYTMKGEDGATAHEFGSWLLWPNMVFEVYPGGNLTVFHHAPAGPERTTQETEWYFPNDAQKSGFLSLPQVEDAVCLIWPHFKDEQSSISRAYTAADLNGDGFIGDNEFGLLLHFLSALKKFCNAETPCRITKKQLKAAVPRIENWDADADAAFDDMDVRKEGHVSLDDICIWMAMGSLKQNISTGGCYRIANSGSSRLLSIARSRAPNESNIDRIFVDLRKSMDLLRVEVSDEKVESWAIHIHACMAVTHRGYHTIERIFEITDGADPYQMIAALFGDCIRFASFGLSPEAAEILQGCIEIKNQKIYFMAESDHLSLVCRMFGFTPGESLVCKAGMDRFLSAIFATCLLKEKIPMVHFAKIIVCMRASMVLHVHDVSNLARQNPKTLLPEWFQTELDEETDQNGERTIDWLYDRFVKINEDYKLGMSQRTIVKAIQRAADSSNRCFGIYATNDEAWYLACAWAYLPEVTPALRSRKLYTVSDYHFGITVATKLLRGVNPWKLFSSFRCVPTPTELGAWRRKGLANQAIAMAYLGAMTVSIATTAAFAELTGGNGPMSFFVGDRKAENFCSYQLGDGLPKLTSGELEKCNLTVHKILAQGTGKDSAFDDSSSPVAAFMYGKLGDEGIRNALEYTDYPMNTERAKALLSYLPFDIVSLIGKDIAKIAVSRTTLLKELLKSLNKNVTETGQ